MKTLILLLTAAVLACEGPTGPQGEPGPQGESGPQGEPASEANIDTLEAKVDSLQRSLDELNALLFGTEERIPLQLGDTTLELMPVAVALSDRSSFTGVTPEIINRGPADAVNVKVFFRSRNSDGLPLSNAEVSVGTVLRDQSLLFEVRFFDTDFTSQRRATSADYTITYIDDGETKIGGEGVIEIK